jgi:hypothetical protein
VEGGRTTVTPGRPATPAVCLQRLPRALEDLSTGEMEALLRAWSETNFRETPILGRLVDPEHRVAAIAGMISHVPIRAHSAFAFEVEPK